MRRRRARLVNMRDRKAKFDCLALTKRDIAINDLFLAIAKLCNGKEIGVVMSAIDKLQELTY